MIYFDNAATTYPKPECVYKELDRAFRENTFNVGRGAYRKSRESYEIIEDTKNKIRDLAKINSGNIVFTPSAAYAMNQIIKGLNIKENSNVYITPFEHNAVARPLKYYSIVNNFNIIMIPYDENQNLNVKSLKHSTTLYKPDFVFVNNLSNVTGSIIDLESITENFKGHETVIIVDAAQSFGLLNIDYSKKNIDYLVFAGHKNLYGPFGIGGYIDFKNRKVESLIKGGTGSNSLNVTETKYEESASKNITSIYALNKSLDWILDKTVESVFFYKKELTDYLINRLSKINKITIYNTLKDINSYIGIVSINHRDYLPDELGQILDEDFDIAVRTGYHCAPYIHELINTKKTLGVVRISLSYFNTKEEIDYLIKSLKEL